MLFKNTYAIGLCRMLQNGHHGLQNMTDRYWLSTLIRKAWLREGGGAYLSIICF